MRLFTVTDRFAVPHGLLLTPGVGDIGDRFQIGALLVIRRPDGSRLECPAYTCDFLHAPNPINNPFLVLTGRTESEVPIGSEVWLADDLALTAGLARRS